MLLGRLFHSVDAALSHCLSPNVFVRTLGALHWLPIKYRCQYKLLLYTFKVLTERALVYLQELLTIHVPTKSLRSENSILLSKPRVRSVLRALSDKYGLIRHIVRIWAKHDLTRTLTCFSMFNALPKCTPRFLTKGASLITQPSNCHQTAGRLEWCYWAFRAMSLGDKRIDEIKHVEIKWR
jgi:hypothetical protein